MNPCSCIFSQSNITVHRNILSYCWTALHAQHGTSVAFIHNAFLDEAWLLLMVDDYLIKGLQIIIAVKHYLGRFGEMTIIREGHSTSLGHIPHFSHFLALLAFGNGTNNLYMNHCRILSSFLQRTHHSRCIHHRIGIWHGCYGSISTCCRSLGARLKILLGFLTRFTKMNVHINKTRANNLTLSINNFISGTLNIACHLGNLAILN